MSVPTAIAETFERMFDEREAERRILHTIIGDTNSAVMEGIGAELKEEGTE